MCPTLTPCTAVVRGADISSPSKLSFSLTFFIVQFRWKAWLIQNARSRSHNSAVWCKAAGKISTMDRDTAQIRTLDSGSLVAAEQDEAANCPFILTTDVRMSWNTAHFSPRFPAVCGKQITSDSRCLPTHVHRGEMRQEGIRARYYLGFPQTGMKECFVIARPLVGVASLYVRHTGRKNWGWGCSNPFAAATQVDEKKNDTCSIVTQLRQLNNALFVCCFVLFFLLVCYDFDLQLHGLMTWSIFYLRKIVFRSELAF